MDSAAIKAAESAESAREILTAALAAWDAAGRPAAEEHKVAAAHSVYSAALAAKAQEARRCLAAFESR